MGSAYGTKCPDILSYRSQEIMDNYDPNALKGFWYEAAHIDVAQIGSSCQTLDFTQADDQKLSCDFKVRYGPLPFTIVENYDPQEEVAHYMKTAQEPGGQFLKLNTVVVDAVKQDDGSYDDLILYSCIDAVDLVPVIELNIATRNREVDKDKLDSLIKRAKVLGV